MGVLLERSFFKDRMLNYIVSNLITNFLKSLDSVELKNVLDSFIDKIEETVEQSETKVDDNLLPVLSFVRDFFSIPDYDDVVRKK